MMTMSLEDPTSFCLMKNPLPVDTPSSSSSSILLHPSLHISSLVSLRIEGPINGLYCVYKRGDIVIWNPATEEVGLLPSALDYLPIGGYDSDDPTSIGCDADIGFGTDPLNEEDYKVLLICHYDKDDYYDEGFCRMLYTTSTNTWRLIEDDNFVGSGHPYKYSSNNSYLNGFYYWLVEGEGVALAFDMSKKEAFRTITTPNIYSENAQCRGDLILHDDHITLFIVNKNLCEIDIWVLMVEESIWTRKISVRGIRGVEKSLGFWKKDDELLLVVDESEGQCRPCHHSHYQTILYNIITQKITNIGPQGAPRFRVTFYYESLVSLGGTRITKYRANHASLVDVVSSFFYG